MAEAEALDLPSPEACVICLDHLTEKAIALPCKHDQFDFGCLGTWLLQQRVCPLCKGPVLTIKYDLSKADGGTIFTLPPPETQSPKEGRHRRYHPYQAQSGSRGHLRDSANSAGRPRTRADRGRHLETSATTDNHAIAFRRQVYQDQNYSLRVGSNRISRYQNFTPASFTTNPALLTRAKTWIRRELSAFPFLDPSSASYGRIERRASNAEFLLDYIVSILKSIDVRGSSGQAEELLKDFLGGANAKLFLHEMEAFLRSPYKRLDDWDRHVQYPVMKRAYPGFDSRYGNDGTNHDR